MTDSRSDDLVRSSAVALARRIRQGELCPVELMEATLERIAAVNGSINAICTLADDAMEKAEAARAALHKGDRWGPLHGLPVGIKDLTPTAGLRTTYGCTLYADHVPDQSALVVSRLEAAGAIVIGKTNTPEFATGGHTDNAVFGPTHNPWDVERTVGGSTGGGGAALACGMIALAEGTDMGGSLRIPAAFCGVVGLRPSLGLIPTVPSPLLWDDLQVTGRWGVPWPMLLWPSRPRPAVRRHRRSDSVSRAVTSCMQCRAAFPTECGSAGARRSTGQTAVASSPNSPIQPAG